ncbi:MAG: phage holin family protein, partial [Myxococcota bacterium]
MYARFFFNWFINVASLLVVVYLLPGIKFDQWHNAILAGLVLGIVNALLRPLIILLTLPINVLSLGIFTLFINGFMFFLASKLVSGFHVDSYWWAFLGAILFGIVSFLLNLSIRKDAGR